jgi:hypothetical protein
MAAMHAAIRTVMGPDIDPEAVMRDLRGAGAQDVPVHLAWSDLFWSMCWDTDDWHEEAPRYSHAFMLPCWRRAVSVPVVCEYYTYFPEDRDDDLANAAMAEVSRRYPEGAALLFKSIPYCVVNNHKYQFGGMLWWRKTWTAFALRNGMKGIDDVIDQVEGGFRIGDDDPRYCDDACSIAVPFNRLCMGLDPNERQRTLAVSAGRWVMAVPASSIQL